VLRVGWERCRELVWGHGVSSPGPSGKLWPVAGCLAAPRCERCMLPARWLTGAAVDHCHQPHRGTGLGTSSFAACQCQCLLSTIFCGVHAWEKGRDRAWLQWRRGKGEEEEPGAASQDALCLACTDCLDAPGPWEPLQCSSENSQPWCARQTSLQPCPFLPPQPRHPFEDPGKQTAGISLQLPKGIRGNSPNWEHLGLAFSPKSMTGGFGGNTERWNLLQQRPSLAPWPRSCGDAGVLRGPLPPPQAQPRRAPLRMRHWHRGRREG